MAIIEALLRVLPPEPIPVRAVMIGVHWTAVCSLGCGLAASLRPEGPHGHERLRDVGRLHEKSVQELAGWALSDHPLEASLGMAAINSLLSRDLSTAAEANAADVLAREGRGRRVAMVGHFPFTERLRALAQRLWVLEKQPVGDDLPAEAAAEVLPQAEVIAITGSALINHTFDDLLALCPPGALVMVLGPSTPLSPVLFDHGVDLLSGAQVVDEAAALLTIQQGAAFPQVRGARLVTVTRADFV